VGAISRFLESSGSFFADILKAYIVSVVTIL